jgi:glycosyltransferase involved in cell wall biosynthesis
MSEQSTPNVAVWLLTHNRPHYLQIALQSVLDQVPTNYNLSITVSDNSDNSHTKDLIEIQFPFVDYIKRDTNLSSANHFKAVMNEAGGDFLVMFHDDDIMLDNYIDIMLKAFERNPRASAVGCNAILIDEQGQDLGLYSNRNTTEQVYDHPASFLMSYLPGSLGVAPFPSYMYRRTLVDPSILNTDHGGKHSDASMIAKLIEKGPIVNLPTPLIKYRIHSSNDSSIFSPKDRLALSRYMTKAGIPAHTSQLREFKLHAYFFQYAKDAYDRGRWKPIIPKTRLQKIIHRRLLLSKLRERPSILLTRLLLGSIISRLPDRFHHKSI